MPSNTLHRSVVVHQTALSSSTAKQPPLPSPQPISPAPKTPSPAINVPPRAGPRNAKIAATAGTIPSPGPEARQLSHVSLAANRALANAAPPPSPPLAPPPPTFSTFGPPSLTPPAGSDDDGDLVDQRANQPLMPSSRP